jgi:putative membrane protein
LIAVLNYWFFRFQLTDDSILIRQGILKKKQLDIKFDRVQGINTAQNIVFRILGLVTVNFDTAGSSGDEGNLPAVPGSFAESLRARIGTPKTLPEDGEDAAVSDPLVRLDWRDMIHIGLADRRVYVMLALIAPLIEQMGETRVNLAENYIKAAAQDTISIGIGVFALTVTAIVVGIIVMFTLISIGAAFLRYHNFELFLEGSTLRSTGGLLTRHEHSMDLGKIQTLRLTQGLIMRGLNFYRLIARQARSSQKNSSSKNFVIPRVSAVQADHLRELLLAPEGDELIQIPVSDRFNSISPYYMRSRILVNALVPVALATLLLTITGNIATLLFMLWIPLSMPFVYLAWRHAGYHYDDQGFVRRSGIIGFRSVALLYRKVQRVTVTQSRYQRNKELATLRVYMASGSVKIPYIKHTLAKQLRDFILCKVESSQQAWH